MVVAHFLALGCSNCNHHDPSYRKWQEELVPRGVPQTGIHTRKTTAEHHVEPLKDRLQAEQIDVPVIDDRDKANWKAWGHGMWPLVHIMDERGCMRGFWAGS